MVVSYFPGEDITPSAASPHLNEIGSNLLMSPLTSASSFPSPTRPTSTVHVAEPTITPPPKVSGRIGTTRKEDEPLAERISSYIALVGVAVSVIASISLLLAISVIVLHRMRRKKNAEKQPVSPVPIPKVAGRRHTLF